MSNLLLDSDDSCFCSDLLHSDDQFLNNKFPLDDNLLQVMNDDLQVMNDMFGDDNNWVSDDDLGYLNSQFGLWNGLLSNLVNLDDQFLNDFDLLDNDVLFVDKMQDELL